jgi:hypothetical protein
MECFIIYSGYMVHLPVKFYGFFMKSIFLLEIAQCGITYHIQLDTKLLKYGDDLLMYSYISLSSDTIINEFNDPLPEMLPCTRQ